MKPARMVSPSWLTRAAALTGLLVLVATAIFLLVQYPLLPDLLPLATSHPLPLVRAHAVWAVRRLGGESALAETHRAETDPLVLAEYETARPAKPRETRR